MVRPVVITGGGTGGHVFPMQAIADALLASGLATSELRYVGSRRGQERELLDGDVALTLLPGRGVRRSWRAKDLVVNVGAVLSLVRALASAIVLVRKWRPSVVVSVGGYASFAAAAAALCWRVPLVLVEFDATSGAAHRLVRRYAVKRCCAFPSEGANVVVTGAPLRDAIEVVDRSPEARDAMKGNMTPPIESSRVVVVVMTGSLGSSRVNTAVLELANVWRTREDVTIVHVTGRRDYEDVVRRRPERGGLDYRVTAFGDMTQLWGVADVAICRAGAITVAELTALAIPSVLVPLPNAPGDHQTKNAQAVVRVGGARMIRDQDCSGAALADVLSEILDPTTRREMAAGAGTLARHDAARAIAEVIQSVRGAS